MRNHGRTNIARAGGAGASTAIGYDGSDRIARLGQNFTGRADDVAWTPTYSHDPSPQAVGIGSTNDAYAYHAGPVTRNYVTNGLNQYASVSSSAWGYDGRGNLTSDTPLPADRSGGMPEPHQPPCLCGQRSDQRLGSQKSYSEWAAIQRTGRTLCGAYRHIYK